MRLLGLRRQNQTLIANGGRRYDVLDVVDRDGQNQKLYFLIDRMMAAEVELLKGKGV